MYIVYSWTREDAPPSHTYRYRKTPESFQLSHLTDVQRTWYQDAPTALGDNSQWRQENTPRPFFKQINEIDTLLSQLTLSFPDIEKTYIQKQPYNIIICKQCHMKIFTPNPQRRWKDAALARKQNDLTWPSWLWWYIITIILCITITITVIIITILPPKVAAPLLTQSDVVSRAASLDPSFSSSGSFLWSLEGSFLIIIMIIVLIGSLVLFIIVFFFQGTSGRGNSQINGLEGRVWKVKWQLTTPWLYVDCEHLSWWRLWWWSSSSSSSLSSSSLSSGRTHGWHQRRWTSKLTSLGKSSFVFNFIVYNVKVHLNEKKLICI